MPVAALLPAHSYRQAHVPTTQRLRSASAEAEARALLVTELYPPDVGGSAVLLHEIYSRLPGPVTVLTADRNLPPHSGRETVVRRPISTRRWGVADPRAAFHHIRVAREVRRLSTTSHTIVHCGRALPEGVSALFNRYLRGAPYVCWAHGEDLVSAWSSRELSLLLRRVYARAEVVFANSRNTASMLQSMAIDAGRIATVYPGVDAERFSGDAPGHDDVRRRFVKTPGTLLLSVGRLQRRKGHDLAIQALARLVRTDDRLQYVIVGDGEERDRLERMARECGVGARVFFVGEVDAADLPAYYAACDIFLLPNRVDDGDIEGFGIVFLEASSSAKAVIGGNSGGVPEAVAHGSTGLLVGGTDADELACAIRRLIDDEPLRLQLGRMGRQRVLHSFTWKRAADLVDGVHRRVASRHRA